jgi:hypothetical protein
MSEPVIRSSRHDLVAAGPCVRQSFGCLFNTTEVGVQSKNAGPRNQQAFGRAWFVSDLHRMRMRAYALMSSSDVGAARRRCEADAMFRVQWEEVRCADGGSAEAESL